MGTKIIIDNLSKRFGGPGTSGAAAVDGVSLEVEPGELFFLLGPSGCGKTTLLRMIAGFIEPTGGRVLFDTGSGGRDVTHVPPNKRNTGMVFQSYALWPHMTVAANVAFGLDVRGIRGEERSRRVREALASVRMEEYEARKPNQLSGGQQQRIALARALVIRPDVLLLDEPLSNLDAKLRIELRSEIRRVCKESGAAGNGITTVYVTHDQKEALSMADRVAIVNRGKVVQVGGPAELYRRPRSRFVAEFLGETNCIEGEVVERSDGAGGGGGAVKTAAGRLVSSQVSESVGREGSRAIVSIRPEAIRLNAPDGMNTMFARVVDSTYLGETAQLRLELAGGVMVHAAMLNPGERANIGERVTVGVRPEDVVVVGE